MLIFIIVILLIIILFVLLLKKNQITIKEKNNSDSIKLFPNYIDGISGENFTITFGLNKRTNCLLPEFINSYNLNKMNQ